MRRKRRRRNSALTFVFFVMTIVFMMTTGLLFAARYKDAKKPVYEYVSMTDEASANAYVWLSQIEENGLTYDDIKNCMGDFNLEIVKTPTKEKGVYSVKIADGSYDYCVSQARMGFEKAYRLAVINRLKISGYEGEISDELVDRLMMEAYDVNTEQYLDEQNVKLLSDFTDISEKYEGERSLVKEENDEKDK